jgi:acetolactate synthase small subunit
MSSDGLRSLVRSRDREVVVRLRDRPASLERFFGTIRRRNMAMEPISMSPLGRDGLLIILRLTENGAEVARWVCELEDLEDVAEVRLSGPPARPGENSGPETEIR